MRDELRDELASEHTRHLQIEKENQDRAADLERQLHKREEAFAQVTASLETERVERRRMDERASATQIQLQELSSTHLQVQKDNQNRIADLQGQLREREERLGRATASFENECTERRRADERASTLTLQLEKLDAELTWQLRVHEENKARVAHLEQEQKQCEEALTDLHSDFEKVSADRGLADEQLEAAANVIAELRQYAAAFEEAKRSFVRTQEKLEARWQTTSDALSERDTKLRKETRERKRLAEALETTEQKLQMQSEGSAIELSKLQAALDTEAMERRRLESETANSRYALLSSVREGRAVIDNLRMQNEERVAELIQRTRRLLELGLHGEQKELTESVLETGLALQTSIQQGAIPEFSSIGSEGEDRSELPDVIPLYPPSDEEPLQSVSG